MLANNRNKFKKVKFISTHTAGGVKGGGGGCCNELVSFPKFCCHYPSICRVLYFVWHKTKECQNFQTLFLSQYAFSMSLSTLTRRNGDSLATTRKWAGWPTQPKATQGSRCEYRVTSCSISNSRSPTMQVLLGATECNLTACATCKSPLKGLLDYAIKIAATWVACKNRSTFYTTHPTPSKRVSVIGFSTAFRWLCSNLWLCV